MDPSLRLLVEFFEAKGLAALKDEDQREAWYDDWIAFQGAHDLYARLLSPAKYSSRGYRIELRRLTRFIEVFAYFSPAHAYSLHVSFLGLYPILQSDNESLKQEAVSRLEAGELFSFAVSERAHGSDLLATEFSLHADAMGELRANGSKYYIGNANVAGLVSVLAKKGSLVEENPARRRPFVFFALRSRETQVYESLRKIRTHGIRTAFVGEFKVADQPVAGGDVICEGRNAWEAVFGAVDFGKFFLGFGAVGICERAFTDSIRHLRSRILYGKSVTDMAHIRSATTTAFVRLVAMKLYACRALDYLQAAGPNERRYLLFNAVQKARVSTEGVKVLALLSECIGAKGFETDTYFETALRESPMIPGLEGSTHINFRLTVQFIDNYFATNQKELPGPDSATLSSNEPPENSYWLGARDRHTRTVQFDSFLAAYARLDNVRNVRLFVVQAKAFREWITGEARPIDLAGDAALSVAVGKCFSIIVYAQLVAENAIIATMSSAMISLMFHGLVQDLTAETMQIMSVYQRKSPERRALSKVVRVPHTSFDDGESVFQLCSARYH